MHALNHQAAHGPDRLKHAGHGGIRQRSQLCTWHNAHGQDGNKQVDGKNAEERDDGCTAYVLAVLRTPGNGDSALDAKENPDAHTHRGNHLIPQNRSVGLSPEVIHEDRRVEIHGEDDGNDGHQKRNELGDGRYDVDARSLFHTTRHKHPAYPHDDRGANDGHKIVSLPEHREEERKAREQQRRIRDRGKQGADPITVGRIESHVLAEPGTRVAVDAARQLRLELIERVETHHEAEHADTADQPADQNGAGIRPGGGHIARHRKNATADYGSDHGRDQMRHRKTIGVVDQVSTPLGKVSHDKPAFCTFIPLAPTSPCQRTSTEYSQFSQINSLQRIIFFLFLPVLAHFHANHLFIMHLYDIYDSSTKRSGRFPPSDEPL